MLLYTHDVAGFCDRCREKRSIVLRLFFFLNEQKGVFVLFFFAEKVGGISIARDGFSRG